jgi:hypothetical protein
VVNDSPLLIVGTGFIVTVTVKDEPVQEAVAGVTVYVACCVTVVVLVRFPVIADAPEPAAPPDILPVTAGADHEYVVPEGTIPLVPFAGVTVKLVALQLVAVMAVTAGFGLTVTVTVKVDPVHDAVAGVTVYVAVATAFVVLVRVWLMLV